MLTEFRIGWRRMAVILLLLTAFAASPVLASEIGANVGAFRLKAPAGGTRDLSSYAGKILVLVFWSFKCPLALAYDSRLDALLTKYQGKGVELIAVAPNQNESPEEIGMNASNLHLSFPVWIDGDGALAERLGITHIPGVVVLDRGSVVRYAGAFDNNRAVDQRDRIAYVDDALDALIAGKPVTTPETLFFGCVIRRRIP